jgi:surface antigen
MCIRDRQSSARQAAARPGEATSRQQARASGRQAAQAPRSRIQCVQYVVANSAFRVRGNARDWWRNSAAIHARSNMPEPGSVLSFRSVKTMPLGHVALVTRVVSEREILVDHANWTRGAISRSHSVIDVSPRNDWTAVRLAVKPGAGASTYGSIYPTDGFIHARARDEVVNLAEKPAEVAPPPFAIPSISPWDAPTTRTSRDPG